MRPIFYLILFALVSLEAISQPEVTPQLSETLSKKDSKEFIPINIRLRQQYDQDLLREKLQSIKGKENQREFVINELTEFNNTKQQNLLSFLYQMKQKGKVKEIHSFWILNGLHCKVLPSVAEALMQHKDIARLDYDKKRYFPPKELDHNLDKASVKTTKEGDRTEMAWHVTKVNAPEAWEMGFTGKDIIVAIIDSGVDYESEELADNMWKHPDFPNHGYDFLDNNDDPMDYDPMSPFGHGTAVAGIVAGKGKNGLITGIAPQAQIMAVRVISSTGGTEATIMQGIEFAVENGAHIMNLSLGSSQNSNPDRTGMRTLMDNALNAGVIASVASGNYGTSSVNEPPYEVGTPGCIPPPWLHPDQTLEGGTSAVVSVGATNQSDYIAEFSSKGPVVWQEEAPFDDYPLDPEMGLIRPDLVAPGQDVPTVITNWAHGDYIEVNGTSFAAPAAAASIALMLSKNPLLSPEQISMLLEMNTNSMGDFKSNIYGSGLLDARASVEATPYPGINLNAYSFDDTQGNNDGHINPGEKISMNISLENTTNHQFENTSTFLRIHSPYVTLTDSLTQFEQLTPGQVINIEDAFTFDVADNTPGNHIIEFSLWKPTLDEYNDTHWETRFTNNLVAPHLVIVGMYVDDKENTHPNRRLNPGKESVIRLKIENQGTKDATEANVISKSLVPYLIYTEHQQTVTPAIKAGEAEEADFPVKVHEDVVPGANAGFVFEVQSGTYELDQAYFSKVGMMENWSEGNFDNFDWNFQGNADWIIDNNYALDGEFSVRSGDIDHNQNSELFIEMQTAKSDSISFYRKVSSEAYDFLEFYINDIKKDRWSGEKDWKKFTYPVEQGSNTFRWVYRKDFMVSEGQDCGWIDRIELPSPEKFWAFAGFDINNYQHKPIQLNGYASDYDEVFWTTEGSGSFQQPGTLQTTYTPSDQDFAAGYLPITLTAYHGEKQASHTLVVSFDNGLSVDEKFPGKGDVLVFPNPATTKITVSFLNPLASPAHIKLLNASGQKMQSFKAGNAKGRVEKSIMLEDLLPGIYFIKIETSHLKQTKKIMIH